MLSKEIDDILILSPDQGNRLNEDEVQKIIEYYKTEIAIRTHGPQLEGIESTSLEYALRHDPNVILVEIYDNISAETIKWPLLVPMQHHIDYSKTFFDEHFPDQPSYMLSLPPYDSIEEFITHTEDFVSIADRLKTEKAVIAYDYLAGSEDGHLSRELLNRMLGDKATLQDVTPKSFMAGRSYGLPKVVHFEGYIEPVDIPEVPAANIPEALTNMMDKGEIGNDPQNGVRYLTADVLKANDSQLLAQIWDIYSEQFDLLTEDHPSLQKQPREELEKMLLDNGAVNIAYMDEGKIAGLLYFVHDIASCAWLNKNFYDERYPKDKGWLAYYPGIVVAKEKANQGVGYAQKMMSCLADAINVSGQKMIITCQCTNISMTYVPKIAASVIKAHPKLRMIPHDNGEDFVQAAEYAYRVMQVI